MCRVIVDKAGQDESKARLYYIYCQGWTNEELSKTWKLKNVVRPNTFFNFHTTHQMITCKHPFKSKPTMICTS